MKTAHYTILTNYESIYHLLNIIILNENSSVLSTIFFTAFQFCSVFT